MSALKIAGTIAGVVAVAAAGIVAGLLTIGSGRITAWAIEHPISSYIGRQVTVAGPVSVHWGSPTRLTFRDLRIANAPWGAAPDMVTAHEVTVEFHPKSLVSGPKNFPLVSIDHAKLLLETSKDGERNWAFLDKLLTPNARSQFPILKKFVANDSEIVFHNGTTGATNHLAVKHAELDAPTPTGSVKVAFDGALQGEPLHIAGTVGPLNQLRNPSKPYPVDLDGSFGESRLAIQGTMRKPLSFSGLDLRVSFEGKKLQQLARTLDIPLPPMPDFRTTGVLTGGGGDWTLKALSAKLGSSDLEGGIAIDVRGKMPYLRANLTSSYIDIADFTGFLGVKPAHSSAPPPKAEAADTSNRIISATPIAVARLNDINAEVGLEAGRVKASKGLPLDRVSASLTLKNGFLTLHPLAFGIADGTVDFSLYLDSTSPEPWLKLDAGISHIDLHALVAGMKLSPLLRQTTGIVGGFVHFTSTGNSLRAFLGHMNGRAALFMENGQLSRLLQEIANLNVLKALGLLATGDQPVPVNCLVSDFDLRHGVATTQTAVLDTTDTLITGRGNFNFPAETIYVELVPYHKTLTLFTLNTPIEIRGTFAEPTVRLNPGGIGGKVAAGAILGVLLPPVGALLPFIDLGLGHDNVCARAFTALKK